MVLAEGDRAAAVLLAGTHVEERLERRALERAYHVERPLDVRRERILDAGRVAAVVGERAQVIDDFRGERTKDTPARGRVAEVHRDPAKRTAEAAETGGRIRSGTERGEHRCAAVEETAYEVAPDEAPRASHEHFLAAHLRAGPPLGRLGSPAR